MMFKNPPSPETTVIEGEVKEYDMPEGALMIPFNQTTAGQCLWIDGGFWDEPRRDSLCCGLPVVDLKGKGQRRSYCEYHFNIVCVGLK